MAIIEYIKPLHPFSSIYLVIVYIFNISYAKGISIQLKAYTYYYVHVNINVEIDCRFNIYLIFYNLTLAEEKLIS